MFTFCILFHENDTKPHFCHHFAQCDIMYPVSRKEWLHYLFMNNNQSPSYNYQHNIYIPTPLSWNRNFSFLLMRFFVPVREYARKIFPFWGLPDNTITTLTMIETNLIHNANAVSQSPDLEGRTKIEI